MLKTALLLALTPLPAQDYVVACASKDAGYLAAAETLRAHHRGKLLRFDPGDLGPLHKQLRALQPRHVAYLVEPTQLDYDLCRRLLQMATELDEDPFVDFAYGFFTGATAAEVQAFVARSVAFKAAQAEIRYGRIAGGVPRSMKLERPHRLRGSQLQGPYLLVAGKKTFPEEGHDRDFVRRELPGLAGHNLLMFIGHGMPREVGGGPDYKDLKGLDFSGAVVLNVPCYNGTTHRYFERDYRAGTVAAKTIPLGESFALAMLRTGVLGYTAYTCPRPAGPELDCDLQNLVVKGTDLGTARRRDYDKTVLGFMGYGSERLQLARIQDGARLPPVRDAVRDMMLEGATGGILFGDPALQPFAPRPGEALVRQQLKPGAGHIDLELDCPAHSAWLVCNDPTARIGRTMALRTYARVPLGKRLVRDVELRSARVGQDQPESTRLIWALESDRGETFLQVKAMLARPTRPGGVEVSLRIHTTEDPALAKARGGTPIPEPAAKGPNRQPGRPTPRPASSGRVDFNRTTISPAMRRLQATWQVRDAVLEEALSLTRLAMTGREAKALAAYKQHGAEGFRALCLLLQLGHHHYRSKHLLTATWDPRERARLFGLTRARPLPHYGDWTLLDVLGLDRAAATRTFLFQALRSAPDGGVFAHAALGLARQGSDTAVPEVVKRLCANAPRDRGVAHLLIRALERFGGEAAKAGLLRYAALPDASRADLAKQTAAKL